MGLLRSTLFFIVCCVLFYSMQQKDPLVSDYTFSPYPKDMVVCSTTPYVTVARNTSDIILSDIFVVKGEANYTEISIVHPVNSSIAMMITTYDSYLMAAERRLQLEGEVSQARFVILKLDANNKIIFYHQIFHTATTQVLDIEMVGTGDILVMGLISGTYSLNSTNFSTQKATKAFVLLLEKGKNNLGIIKWMNIFTGSALFSKLSSGNSADKFYMVGSFSGTISDQYGVVIKSVNANLKHGIILDLNLQTGAVVNYFVLEVLEPYSYLSIDQILVDTSYIYVGAVANGTIDCNIEKIIDYCEKFNTSQQIRLIAMKLLKSNLSLSAVQIAFPHASNDSIHIFLSTLEMTSSFLLMSYTQFNLHDYSRHPYSNLFYKDTLNIPSTQLVSWLAGKHSGCKVLNSTVYCVTTLHSGVHIETITEEQIIANNNSIIIKGKRSSFLLQPDVIVTDIDVQNSRLIVVGNYYTKLNSTKDVIFVESNQKEQGFLAFIQVGCNCDNPLCLYGICNGYLATDYRVCSGRGKCLLNNHCSCIEQSKGRFCTDLYCNNIDSRDELNVCSGHGDCHTYGICSCDPGYGGPHCKNATCACQNMGICLDSNFCKCPVNYTGIDCSKNIIDTAPITVWPEYSIPIQDNCYPIHHSLTQTLLSCSNNAKYYRFSHLDKSISQIYLNSGVTMAIIWDSNSTINAIYNTMAVSSKLIQFNYAQNATYSIHQQNPDKSLLFFVNSVSSNNKNLLLITGSHVNNFEFAGCFFQSSITPSGFALVIDMLTGRCINHLAVSIKTTKTSSLLGGGFIEDENSTFVYGIASGDSQIPGYLHNKTLSYAIFFVKYFNNPTTLPISNVLIHFLRSPLESVFNTYENGLAVPQTRMKYFNSMIFISFNLFSSAETSSGDMFVKNGTTNKVVALFDSQGFTTLWSVHFYCPYYQSNTKIEITSETIFPSNTIMFVVHVTNCGELIANEKSKGLLNNKSFSCDSSEGCSWCFEISNFVLKPVQQENSKIFISSTQFGYAIFKSIYPDHFVIDTYTYNISTAIQIGLGVSALILLCIMLVAIMFILLIIFVVIGCKCKRKIEEENTGKHVPIIDEFEMSYMDARVHFIREHPEKGGEATIYIADNNEVAKVYNCGKNKDLFENARNELKLITQLHHSNIVGVTRIFHGDGKLGYFMKQADCNLKQYLESNSSLSDNRKLNMIYGIARGMYCLHENMIIHCDLKPQNILMYDNIPVICDFGQSVNLTRATFARPGGTRKYRAPEIENKGGKLVGFSKSSDIYSFGVVALEIIANCELNEGLLLSPTEAIARVKSDNYNFFEKVYTIIAFCLKLNPQQRFTFTYIVSELQKLV